MFEDFIIKYSWSAVGLLISSIPVFFPDYAGARTKREEAALKSITEEAEVTRNGSVPQTNVAMKASPVQANSTFDKRTGSRTQGFITNKRLLISLADAGGRIMYSFKELSELAGYTFRVYNTLKIFKDLKEGRFVGGKSSVAPLYSIRDSQGQTLLGYQGDSIYFLAGTF